MRKRSLSITSVLLALAVGFAPAFGQDLKALEEGVKKEGKLDLYASMRETFSKAKSFASSPAIRPQAEWTPRRVSSPATSVTLFPARLMSSSKTWNIFQVLDKDRKFDLTEMIYLRGSSEPGITVIRDITGVKGARVNEMSVCYRRTWCFIGQNVTKVDRS